MNKNNSLCIHAERRRLLGAAVAVSAMAWIGAARAQAKPPVLIGWLDPGSRESTGHLLMAFKEGLASHGWKESAQYVIEERWMNGRLDQLARLAQELAAKNPHVIVTAPSTLVVAVAKAAPNTPIVQASGSPLEAGIVASLARPGGMITGVSNVAVSVSEKSLEFLLDAMPKVRRVGFLIDPKSSSYSATKDSAQRSIKHYSVDARFGEVSAPEEIEPTLARLAREGVEAIVVMPNTWFISERQRITKFALAHRLPVVAGSNEYADTGALLSYGSDRSAQYRRTAYYVDRILKGAKPGDLPIEQPTVFNLIVNMKTAKALGITIPPSILVRATKVIE